MPPGPTQLSPIYLDHSATTPLSLVAADAMREAALGVGAANPASQHAAGRSARRLIEDARAAMLALLGAEPKGPTPDRLVFTSGGTESNHLAIRGILSASGKRRLVISQIEHPSVMRTSEALEAEGYTVHRVRADARGVVRCDDLERLLDTHQDEIGLVSVMLASNETGVVQPVARIAALARKSGVPVHTDAVQAVGKAPVDFRALGVSALTFAPHKFHGPIGLGGLVLAPDVEPRAQMHGGFQQSGQRPGTESAPLVAGALAAMRDAADPSRHEQLCMVRDRLESGLLATWPDAVVLGAGAPRASHLSCIAFPGADRQALVMAYDVTRVACSSGSACASGSSEPSPALLAMGIDDRLVRGAIRFSVGASTTIEHVEEAVRRIAEVNSRVRSTA